MKKTLTLQEALQRDAFEPLHVINEFLNNANSQSADLYLAIRDGGNDLIPLRVPSTWVPIALTEVVSRKSLLESHHFRTALKSKALAIASPEYVASLETNKLAQEEYERLERYERARNNPRAMEELIRAPRRQQEVSTVDATDVTTEVNIRDELLAQEAVFDPEETEEVAKNKRAVNNEFRAWAHAMNDYEESAARARILSRGTMSPAQVAYLAKTVVHVDLRKRLAAWLTQRAAKSSKSGA